MSKANNIKTVMFQGVKCAVGYDSIAPSSYYGTNLNSWFTTVLLIKVPKKYKKGGHLVSVNYMNAYSYGYNIYKCYLPIEHNLKLNSGDFCPYFKGSTIYVSDEVVGFNPVAPQNGDYISIIKDWEHLQEHDKLNIIKYCINNFDVDKHWDGLSDILKEMVIQCQVFNFDVDKYWEKLTKHQKSLVCMFQIYNLDINKYWRELIDAQRDHVFNKLTHKLHIDSWVWEHTTENRKQALCAYYNKKLDVDYKKVNGTWCAVLPS